jgi:hypothetical protein
MAKSKKRTIEYYVLTISGLSKTVHYWQLINEIVSKTDTQKRERSYGEDKTDFLLNVKLDNDKIALKFGTFAPGVRPDVIDRATHEIQDSP